MRRDRSKLEALNDQMRTAVRDGAVARATTGLPRRGTSVSELGEALHGRAGHQGEPGAPAGTYNGRGPNTSANDGVELLASAIEHRVSWQRRPKSEQHAAAAFMPRKKA